MATRDVTARDMLHRAADWFPQGERVVDGLFRYTYPQLREQVQRCAALYHQLGVRKGDRVALMTVGSVQHVVALFGAIELGAIPAALHVRESVGTLSGVLEQLSPRVLVYDGAFAGVADELRQRNRLVTGFVRIVSLHTPPEQLTAGTDPILPRDLEGYRLDFEPMEIHEHDTAIIALSSGTTGLPKGVMLGQGAMRDAMLYTVLAIGLRYEDVWFPPTASGWITFILGSFNLVNGMTVVLPNGDFDSVRFLDFVGRYRVTATIIVPLMMQRLLDEYDRGGYDLSSLRLVTYGSSPARPALIRRTLDTFGCELMQLYGITEATGGWVSFLHHDDHLRGLSERPELLSSCGRCGVHMELSIRDERGRPLPAGEVGEVWIRASTNMRGYLNLPELTAQTLVDGWLKTHDLGRLDADGYLYLTDRKNFLIISGAANIYPSVVETVLAEHPAVREVAVIGAPHPEWGEAVVATVSLREGAHVTAEELLAFCRPRLAKYEVPKHIEIVPLRPKGLTGKVLKKNIQGWYWDNPTRLPWKPVD